MSVVVKMQISWGAIWFGTKLLDYLLPPADPIFNASLAILAALCVAAAYFEERANHPQWP